MTHKSFLKQLFLFKNSFSHWIRVDIISKIPFLFLNSIFEFGNIALIFVPYDSNKLYICKKFFGFYF